MSELHELCRLSERPINDAYINRLRQLLTSGIPATYTVEEAENYVNGIEEESKTTTTPLHLLCENYPKDLSKLEEEIIIGMVDILFEYGAGWCLTDKNQDTPGCILVKRGLDHKSIYSQIVDAGVRAELLLRKVSEFDMEVIEDTDDLDHSRFQDTAVREQDAGENSEKDSETPGEPKDDENELELEKIRKEYHDDPSNTQETFLKTELEYKDSALLTRDRKDGVMMSWETELMRMGAETLFKGQMIDDVKDEEVNILNIGFGMGIIDSIINEMSPTHHYICEAHPDVLKKLKEDGWYDKKNVTILGGRWQEQLSKLLSEGNIFFNGIYYDTYSEHYEDMLDLFDNVVGLLKPHGVFSFFNGLGADRKVVYDVYKKLVEIDLSNYGLVCTFVDYKIPEETMKEDGNSVWDGVKKSYWNSPIYYHPEVRFIEL